MHARSGYSLVGLDSTGPSRQDGVFSSVGLDSMGPAWDWTPRGPQVKTAPLVQWDFTGPSRQDGAFSSVGLHGALKVKLNYILP